MSSRKRLLHVLRELVDGGTTVLFITHDMEDLRDIADRILTINNKLIRNIDLNTYFSDESIEENQFGENNNLKMEIQVKLPSGNTLQLYGQPGSATIWHFQDALERSLFAQILAFNASRDVAEIVHGDSRLNDPCPYILRKKNIRLLLADRRSHGMFHDLTVFDNYLAVSGRYNGLVLSRVDKREVAASLEKAGVKYPSITSPVSTLSGGNQQRLLWGALTDSGASFIIAEEPLWGLDADARQSALHTIDKLADSGRGVIVLTCFPHSYPAYGIHVPERVVQ